MTRFVAIALSSLVLLFQLGCSSQWVKKQYEAYHQRQGQLDVQTVTAGLKEALEQGTRNGVATLGRAGGYLDNPEVKIPLPEDLQKAEKWLRRIGAGRYADEFTVSLNRAAEAAVPRAKAIFVDVIRNMTIRDGMTILRGPDDAATQYFRRHAQQRLIAAFRPIVAQMTQRVGVTADYKRFVDKAIRVGLVKSADYDLDSYVTKKALDGLFSMVAQEERRIRRDPVARTTELLRKVFS
ncbi:MAG: DUF4197 domain-containing protein [Acidiferrobacterales bacterium]